jgi:hypothetical protein
MLSRHRGHKKHKKPRMNANKISRKGEKVRREADISQEITEVAEGVWGHIYSPRDAAIGIGTKKSIGA